MKLPIDKLKKAKILFYDIETFPNLGYTWGIHEQEVIKIERPWSIASFAYKYLGGPTKVLTLPDYPLYKKDPFNDKALLEDIAKIISEAGIKVAQNGNQFDAKKIKTRMLYHKMKPIDFSSKADTLLTLRREFNLNSNRLNDVTEFLKIGEKVKTGGFDLWYACMNKDMNAWRKMKIYNKQDVILLENLFLELLPWDTHTLNIGTRVDVLSCVACGSTHLNYHGVAFSGKSKYRRVQCVECGHWMRDTKNLNKTQTLRNI